MKKLFFENSDTDKKKVENEKDPCDKCGLFKNCATPKMQPTGKGRKRILVIAEAPGRTEDEEGIQLIGTAGQTLRAVLKEVDIDLDRDCLKTNAIICRPSKNKTPSTSQINYCRSNLLKTIKLFRPEKIITLGTVALQSLIGKKIAVSGISKWIKWKIPDIDYKCWIYPNYHPQYLNYNDKDKVLKKIFKETLREAVQHDEEFPEIDIEYIINTEKNKNRILNFLKLIQDGDTITFDYETTGIKPHREGHRIVCMSIGLDYSTMSFPLFCDEIKDAVRKILANKDIKKIAHNLKFEHQWSKVILGVGVQGWDWDTMIAAHILDNRTGICGLKFQTYVNFGVAGYDDDVAPYLKSDSKSANAFNTIDKCDSDKLLYYCGLDSYFTRKLADKQKDIFVDLKNRQKAMSFFMEGIIEFADIQSNGMAFDFNVYKKNSRILEKKMKILHEKIQNSEEVQQLDSNEPFNFNSTKQLRHLLYDILNWEADKKTPTGMNSTDKEALESFFHPFTDIILKHRRIEKIKNTYLAQFEREAVDVNGQCFVFPSLNLHTVATFRPSCNNPNLLNIPQHDAFAKKMTRTCFIPRKGHKLLEVDYSGIEVRISACYHKDPVMIDYIENPNSDMHRDVAIDIFRLEPGECTKELRYLAKNGFVFPQFYGDWWEHCAKNIWNNLTEEQYLFLKKKGFKRFSAFENHIEKVEDVFWNERFVKYTSWKDFTYRRYEKTGYVKLKTGFKCFGPMRKNEVLNYSIQGTAFHVLLWSLIQLNKWLKKMQMNSKIILQIYDSIVFDIDPAEENILKPMIRQIMCVDVREHFKWIIVPLDIEAEITEIDGSWYTKKECKI